MIKASNIQVYTPLNKKTILQRVSQKTVMEYYLKIPVDLKGLVCSPMREDHNPSCSFWVSPSGALYFKDWAEGLSWDCFNLVMHKYKVDYFEALEIINRDLKLGLGGMSAVLQNHLFREVKLQPKKRTKYEIIPKPWDDSSLSYWNSFGINREILDRFKVYNLRCYYSNETLSGRARIDSPMFCYHFSSGNIKIYRPLISDKKKKWRTNTTIKDVNGYDQLNHEGKLLVITSSLKDVMVLHTLGIPAIAPQSEGASIPAEVLKSVKKRFKNVIILYDNDEPGIKAATKLAESTKFNLAILPDGPKDIADVRNKFGHRKTKKIMQKIIKDTLIPRREEDIPF